MESTFAVLNGFEKKDVLIKQFFFGYQNGK